MTFLQGVPSLSCRLVHHTGTMIRFTTGQLDKLPVADVDCKVELPDGANVDGRFRRHPQNPYIGGPGIVRWIKSWVPYNVPTDAVVHQSGTGNRVRVEVVSPIGAAALDLAATRKVLRRAKSLRSVGQADRRRKMYAAWERDPNLRGVVLAAWGSVCQVAGCGYLATVPAHIRANMVDVHHLNHVAKGGTDSPMNVCVLCVVHHQLIHRAPTSSLESWDLDGATVVVNGLTLNIARDARLIL